MSTRHKMSASILLLALAGLLSAQSPPPAPSAAPASPTSPPKPGNELKIVLMDGAIVVGKLSVPDLTIETKFGTLKVPVDQIQSFAPGLQSHPQFQQSVNGYVNDLAADAFADREKAQAALTKIGPDIRTELERQLKTAEAEKQVRLQKIIEDFESLQSADDADKSHSWVTEDVINTPGFTVVGRITTPSFSVASPYGTLQLKMEDIREAHRDAMEAEEIRKNAAVGAQAIAQRQFTNTGIRLNKGDQIFITATGTIQMPNFGNNATATPDGTPNGNIGTVQAGIPNAALIGRIGDSGTYLKLGSKATVTADRAGILMLGISTNPNNDFSSYTFNGEYQVKIRVLKKAVN